MTSHLLFSYFGFSVSLKLNPYIHIIEPLAAYLVRLQAKSERRIAAILDNS